MSMWQYFSALNGYVDAHAPKDGNKLTESEIEDIFDSGWLEAGQAGPQLLSTQTYWWDERGPVPLGVVTFAVQ